MIYCDPPYANTTPYAGAPVWDAAAFWATMHQWSALGASVFVSEYAAPDPWRCVWSSEQRASLKATDNQTFVTEKLFTL